MTKGEQQKIKNNKAAKHKISLLKITLIVVNLNTLMYRYCTYLTNMTAAKSVKVTTEKFVKSPFGVSLKIIT